MTQGKELDFLKKDMVKLISKDEIMERFHIITSDFNAKLQDKLKVETFKKLKL